MVFSIVLIIILIVLFYFYCKRNKKFHFDSIVMVNGSVGSGKSLMTIYQARRSHKKAHGIWWRRVHIWSIFKPSLKFEEEPLLYSNIPIYANFKKNELYKYYRPLITDYLLRKKRFNFKSIIIIDESSLVANSTSGVVNKSNPMALVINEQLTLFLKLIRHELHGSYRNIFGTCGANLYINTQSKNDNHFAFDRSLNQVLYITKSVNLPFFKLVYCRDLLLIDSVENNFNDDVKEDLSSRWYLIPKKIFKMYDSYSYSFLSDDLDICSNICKYIVLSGRFEIATFLQFTEIKKSNELFFEYLKIKESEEQKNG